MDDLTKKTDDELRDIMRHSVGNAYVPSSIYHRAKQELEFRTQQNPIYNLTNSNLSINSTNVQQSTQTGNGSQHESEQEADRADNNGKET